ncbi:hypothetical protein ACFO1B_14920 [Dactylosporangium siamense]|uniref:Uncharacterized protein n=1 Tax=Dactylosporangium siamense TaxID=685454 RepID=A0A919PMH5_9ACTN|nr:hypothetical protein [Dactylosporangium siamense]GIG45125.1 hypothetical protein Dsi01nite_031660 [Dactylosporangium siamense]
MFACKGCRAELTVPMAEVALPAHAHQNLGHTLIGPLMEPGTFAVDPDPPAWLRFPGAPVVIAPGDLRGTVFRQDLAGEGCLGVGGGSGPNLVCERCGRVVATRIDDCGRWQAVWLDPAAVLHIAGPARPQLTWEELRTRRAGVDLLEQNGSWSPVWSAALAAALARVLAVSGGAPVTADGALDALIGPALAAMLPAGPPPRPVTLAGPARSVTLAGPGLPPGDVDVALVPRHPQTGAAWTLPGAGNAVPLEWDVWAPLAYRPARGPVPLPAGERRDDPPPLLPSERFWLDRGVFVATLRRLPELDRPWLRAIHDRAESRGYGWPLML